MHGGARQTRVKDVGGLQYLLTFSPYSYAFTWQRTDKCSEKSLIIPENDLAIKYIIH